MTGVVRGREALVRLTVRGPLGQVQKIDAVIDTGFTAFLTLPPEMIADLGLRWRTSGRGTLADGSQRNFEVYDAIVLWNRRPRHIIVTEADSTPLLGMAMLAGYELNVQVRPRGRVTIAPLPDEPSRRRRR